jgi:hypothetical protein
LDNSTWLWLVGPLLELLQMDEHGLQPALFPWPAVGAALDNSTWLLLVGPLLEQLDNSTWLWLVGPLLELLEMGEHGLQPALFLGQLTLQLLHYLHLDLGLGRALVRYSMRTERVTIF